LDPFFPIENQHQIHPINNPAPAENHHQNLPVNNSVKNPSIVDNEGILRTDMDTEVPLQADDHADHAHEQVMNEHIPGNPVKSKKKVTKATPR
jgi:hypothetical protein